MWQWPPTRQPSRLTLTLHHVLQTKPDKKGLAQSGLDLINGAVRNNIEAGVVEPALSKLKIIQVWRCCAVCMRALAVRHHLGVQAPKWEEEEQGHARSGAHRP